MKENSLYKVVVSEKDVNTTVTYRGSSKKEVQQKALRDMVGHQKIMSIEKVKTSKERVFLSRSEVAEIYGVDPQTISNYVTKGVLKPAHCSKDRMMFDITMVESLRSSVAEIEQCHDNISKLKENLKDVQKNLSKEVETARASLGIDVNSKNNIGSNLLKTMMEVGLGRSYSRMYTVLNDYLQGKDVREISKIYWLTPARVIQIINKAIDELGKLRPYNELVDELDAVKAENNFIKRQIAALQAELMTFQSYDTEMSNITEEDREYYALFNTKLDDLNISVRTLKPLIGADIETVGELVQWNKLDLLRLRNFGKKALTELEDVLESMNLSFGMKDKVLMVKKKCELSDEIL